MKKNIKLLAVAIAAIMTIGSIAFVSCNKENEMRIQNTSNSVSLENSAPSLPYFSNMESLWDAINTATSFDTLPNLINYETSQGRQSIGTLSDAFYESINPNSFVDRDQVLAFYENHKEFLDTLMKNGEIAVVPEWFNTPYRYVANSEGLFRVDTFVYKLFKSCIVAAPISHLADLEALQESELDNANPNIFHFTKESSMQDDADHSTCIYKWKKKNDPDSQTDRIHIILKTHTVFTGTDDAAETYVQVYNLHKWAGIWWTSRHTLHCEGFVDFHTQTYDCTDWNIVSKTFNVTRKCNTLYVYDIHNIPCCWRTINRWNFIFGCYKKYHHYSRFDIVANYPGHVDEVFSEN